MKLDYKNDVKINDAALDLEWEDQAELAVRYGEAWTVCKKKVAILDEKVKVVRSKLVRKAWEDPPKHLGQPKGSIQTVEAFYRTHKKHIKAKEELFDAEEELDLITIAKNEIGYTRKTALENMVKLYIAGYFAGPSVPRDLSKLRNRMDDMKEASDKQVKVKRIKNKKK